MSNDLISRQEAIRRYCADECRYDPEGCNGVENCSCVRLLKSLPSAQRWIPCSERLPEEETDVLVCNANGEIQIASGSYSTEMKDYFIWYTAGWMFGKVIAWMPLPEPYVERREQNER